MKFEPGFIGKNNWKNYITSSSCEGYSPFVNNIKDQKELKALICHSEPCLSGNQDNACWKITKGVEVDEFAETINAKIKIAVIGYGEVFIEKSNLSEKDFSIIINL